jgi:hypothetical protein
MEEDVKPKDQDGVDGWGVCGWDGWVCGLGAVDASLVFGLVRGAGAFSDAAQDRTCTARAVVRSGHRTTARVMKKN